jgi:hypothetical protein
MTTSRSSELRALAQRIVDLLPPEAADDVVLAGSVSRGVADAGSDVELLLFRNELPALDLARGWASGAGVEATSVWASPEVGYVAGVADVTAIELLWLTPETLESLLERASSGELVDHRRLPVFEALQHGIALRGLHLPAWQERLRTYPEPLHDALIRDAVDDWGGYPVGIYTRQAWRNDPYALRRVSLEIADDVLRLLFALNRWWEPTWKRLPQLLEPLPLKPERTAERIEAALSADGREAMLTLFELARDALALVPPELDVERARAWLDDAVGVLQ